MTDLPDDEPQPGSRAWMEQTAQLDSAMATARRYLSALNAQDHPACNAILVELACDRDGSMVKAFMALAAQALDFAHVLDQLGVLDGGSLQEYLDRRAVTATLHVESHAAGLAAQIEAREIGSPTACAARRPRRPMLAFCSPDPTRSQQHRNDRQCTCRARASTNVELRYSVAAYPPVPSAAMTAGSSTMTVAPR